MTEVRVTTIHRYIGLSSDTKATTGVPAGSYWYETDTGAQYVYDGTAWGLDLVGGPPYRATKTLTFTGAANLGAIGNVPLFTITGAVVVVLIVPLVTTTLVGVGATLALGVTNSTALFITATTGPNLATGEFWTEATGGNTANAGVAVPAALKDIAISSNIVGTVAVAAVTAGVARWDVWWRPLSADGKVAAA